MTFVPSTSRARRSILLRDFDKFARRLRIQHIFRDSPREHRKNPFYVPSSWTPNTIDNPELELYIKNTRSKVESLPFERQRSNFQLEQRCALISLSNRTDLIIKKADKGSLTVIKDREQYVKECFQHLFQSNVYKIYFKDPSHDIYRKVVSLSFDAFQNHVITKGQHHWAVIPRNFIRIPYFYALKKGHKTPMTIRPIISGINGSTTRLSGLVDFYLQPIASTSTSLIRDSKHFIRVLEDTIIPEDAILVTLDVKD